VTSVVDRLSPEQLAALARASRRVPDARLPEFLGSALDHLSALRVVRDEDFWDCVERALREVSP
jgi:hypothetical protein